ncbi:hypothetical protein CapIbe_012307 [Capra ibex]
MALQPGPAPRNPPPDTPPPPAGGRGWGARKEMPGGPLASSGRTQPPASLAEIDRRPWRYPRPRQPSATAGAPRPRAFSAQTRPMERRGRRGAKPCPLPRRSRGRRAQRRIRVGGEQRFGPLRDQAPALGFLQAFVFRCSGSGSRTKDASASGEGRGHPGSPARLEGGGKGGARRGHREPTDNGIPGRKNNNQVFAFISRVPAAASGSRAEGGAPHGARPGLRTAQPPSTISLCLEKAILVSAAGSLKVFAEEVGPQRSPGARSWRKACRPSHLQVDLARSHRPPQTAWRSEDPSPAPPAPSASGSLFLEGK